MIKLKNICATLLILPLISCGTIEIHDQEWCSDQGELGASCFHTQTKEERDISKEDWDIQRVGMFCATPEVFSDYKRSIIQLCEAYDKCIFDKVTETVIFEDIKDEY